MNKEMMFYLRSIRSIVKDKTWNNEDFENISKITDANITKILKEVRQ